jgi:ribosome-associated protein
MAAPDEPLAVRPGLVIPAAELDERFSPSGGPGGQHANRAHTRVELRVDLTTCSVLTEHQRARLVERFGDDVRVVVDEERSQLRNRSIARERLAARLRAALVPTRTRRATRPTKGSRQRRLEGKRQRSQVKRDRRRPSAED